jgi:LDH2 family malate/lactate/ureidoglycolate dehydrogenase
VLLEGDLLGHTPHGLQLLAPYLRDIEAGRVCCEGEPIVIADHARALTWDGRFLPGPWLVLRAMEAILGTHPRACGRDGRDTALASHRVHGGLT